MNSIDFVKVQREFEELLAACWNAQLAQRPPARSWAGAYALLIVVVLLSVLSACSSVPVTPVGTYTINGTVTAGNFSIVVPITVTVTK